MRSFVRDLYPRFFVKTFRCAVSPVLFYGLFSVEFLRALIELSFSCERFSSSFIRKIFGKRFSVRSLAASFYLRCFVWAFLVCSIPGVLSLRSFAGTFYLRLFVRAFLCIFSHLFSRGFLSVPFSMLVFAGLFIRAVICRGNFHGSFRLIIFLQENIRSIGGADSLHFFTGLLLALFLRVFFPYALPERIFHSLFRSSFLPAFLSKDFFVRCFTGAFRRVF